MSVRPAPRFARPEGTRPGPPTRAGAEGLRVSAEEFERIALAEPDRAWELHRGRLREKPAMVFRHNDFMFLIGMFIGRQLDLTRYRVRVNAGHVRRTVKN